MKLIWSIFHVGDAEVENLCQKTGKAQPASTQKFWKFMIRLVKESRLEKPGFCNNKIPAGSTFCY